MTGISPTLRFRILADYKRKSPDGDYLYTIERIAGRNQVTTGQVNVLRVQAGLQRQRADQGPSLYGCPVCSYRALHPCGHAVCLGDAELAAIEASQTLTAVGQSVGLGEEVTL